MRAVLFAALALAATALGGCAATGVPRATAPEAGAAAQPDRLLLVTIQQARVPPPPPAGGTRKDTGWSLGYRVTSAARRTAAALARDYSLRAIDAWPIEALGVHCVVYRVGDGEDRDKVLHALAADARVESAQSMQVFDSLSDSGANGPQREPPDPATDRESYRALQYNLDLLHVEAAHRWARGRGVRIAVIDTGLDLEHPELAGRVVEHADLAGVPADAEAGFAADRHGTAVAGIIAAGSAGRMRGIAPAADLIALRACWPTQAGALEARCNSFTLARALALALSLHSDIVNLSLAGPPDPLLDRLLRQLLARGVIVVGAVPEHAPAGPQFPTSTPQVIAVQAAGVGPAEVAVAEAAVLSAPSTNILTLAPQARYVFQSGSSAAAAQVSGLIALLVEREPTLSPARVRNLLTGGGRNAVDACAALGTLLQRDACAASEAVAVER